MLNILVGTLDPWKLIELKIIMNIFCMNYSITLIEGTFAHF